MTQRITRKSYLLLLATAISVVPFLLFAGYSLVQLVQSKQEELQRELIDRSQATANAVAERLAISTGALRALASTDAAAKGDMAAIYSQAKRMLQDMPVISAISLVTPDFQVQFMTLLPYGQRSFLAGDEDSVRKVFETGKPVVSEPFRSPIDKQIIITSVAVPVFRDGRIVYCLRAIFRNSTLNDLLAAQHMPSDWTSVILSRSGMLQARSRSPEPFVGKPGTAVVLEAMTNHRRDVFDGATKEGDPIKIVLVPIPGWDWHVAVGVPSIHFEEPLQRAIWFLGIFGLATLVLGGIFVGWICYVVRGAPGASPLEIDTAISKLTSVWPSAVALAVALVVGGLGTRMAQDAQAETGALTNLRQATNKERRKIIELLSAYKDIETSQRGFVITGEDAFLEPYRNALPVIPLLTDSLKLELKQLGITSFSWSDLDSYSAQRLLSAAKGIELRRELGPKAIEDSTLFDNGKQLMDKLRFMLENLDTQLEAQTQRINEAIPAQEQKTRHLQWLSQFTVGALVLLSISIWLYERRRRHAAFKQLEQANATLEDRVAKRTLELSQASARIRNYTLETEALLDQERKRLSREVHDQIGQIFTGLKMIARTLKPGSLADEQHDAMMNAIESGVKISRRISAELRPPLLDDFGVRAALDHYLKTVFEPLGIAFELQLEEVTRLSAQQKNQLFRMVQEACTNVIRHANAHQVEIIGRKVDGALEVCIEDDGIGIDRSRVRTGALGLTGIEERAKLSGALLLVEPRVGGGTRLVIRYPDAALLPEAAP